MPAQRDKTLEGKTVFLIGDPAALIAYEAGLMLHGAKAVRTQTVPHFDSFTHAIDATCATEEILKMHPRPDAVILVHPKMNLDEETKKGNFEGNAVMQLAGAIHKEGIPTLVLDIYRDPSYREKLTFQQCGVTFQNLLHIMDANQALEKVAEMIAPKNRAVASDGLGA